MTEDERQELMWVVGELRHAYENLINETVKNQLAFAKGLIGPQIERIEKLLNKPIEPTLTWEDHLERERAMLKGDAETLLAADRLSKSNE